MSQNESPPNDPVEPMPDSIKLAAVSLSLLAALLISNIVVVIRMGGIPVTEPIGVALTLLVLYGLLRGNRLAYLWGRRIGLAGAVLNAIIAIGHVVTATAGMGSTGPGREMAESVDSNSHLVLAGICAAAAVAQLFVFVSLGDASAALYFRLRCPQCLHDEAFANDSYFEQVKCGRCGAVWQ